MNNVQWSAEYSVGIAKIDEQHQDLFGMINELQFLLMRDWNRDMVKASFERFVKKITEHFDDEESYMELFNYPSKTTHQHYHQELLQKANDVRLRLNAQTLNLTVDVADYMEIWLTHHVEGPDRALGIYLIQRGLV